MYVYDDSTMMMIAESNNCDRIRVVQHADESKKGK